MLDDADCLQLTLAAWEKVRLSERLAILDQQGLQIADNREEASSGRGALKDVIRAFKSTPQEERAGTWCSTESGPCWRTGPRGTPCSRACSSSCSAPLRTGCTPAPK